MKYIVVCLSISIILLLASTLTVTINNRMSSAMEECFQNAGAGRFCLLMGTKDTVITVIMEGHF